MKKITHMIYGADYNPDQWLSYPDIIDEDFRLMPMANMNSITIGIFSWKELEPREGEYHFEWLDDIMNRAAKENMKVVLATPSAARPYWMDEKYPEVRQVSDTGVRRLHGIRHNHCMTSPYYRKKVVEMDTMIAKRYKDHPALAMWHIGNEFQGECFCPLCQNAFRDWLREKYDNDIQKVNEQWWMGVWSRRLDSFEEIEAPSSIGETLVHGLNLDWKRFCTHQIVSFIKEEADAVKAITPDIPVTTNLMARSDAFDQWKVKDYVDLVSLDSYPSWGEFKKSDIALAQVTGITLDVCRSLKKNTPFFIMESTPSLVNWTQVNKIKKPGMNALSSMQAIAHGSDSIQYFQWRSARGASEKFHGTVVGHNRRSDTRVFQEVTKLGAELKKLEEVTSSVTRAEVALIFDWENRWAIRDMMGMTKYLNYEEICEEHYIPFWKQGISVDVIDMDQDFLTYQVLVAPMLYSLRPKVGERLREFVKQGGTLILTYGTGYVNENDLCYLGGFPGDGLMEVAGLEAEEIDALAPEENNEILLTEENKKYTCNTLCELLKLHPDTQVLATYEKDFYQGMPAVTCHRFGEGECYYMATRTDGEYLDAFYRRLMRQKGIAGNGYGTLPEGVTVQRREKDHVIFDFYLNFTQEEKMVSLEPGLCFWNVLEEREEEEELCLKPYGYKILRREV